MVWRPLTGLALASFALVLVAACGSDDPGQPGEDQFGDAVTASPSATAQAGDTRSGLDPECVQAVLGRPATGFADITSAERTQIFSVCSPEGDAPDPNPLTRPPAGAGIDFECVETELGREVNGFEDLMALTEEERAQVLEECGGGQFGVRPINGTPFPGGPTIIRPGQGGVAINLAPECIEQALGKAVEDIAQLTPEERMAAFQQCAPSRGFAPASPQQ